MFALHSTYDDDRPNKCTQTILIILCCCTSQLLSSPWNMYYIYIVERIRYWVHNRWQIIPFGLLSFDVIHMYKYGIYLNICILSVQKMHTNRYMIIMRSSSIYILVWWRRVVQVLHKFEEGAHVSHILRDIILIAC